MRDLLAKGVFNLSLAMRGGRANGFGIELGVSHRAERGWCRGVVCLEVRLGMRILVGAIALRCAQRHVLPQRVKIKGVRCSKGTHGPVEVVKSLAFGQS